MARKVEEVYTYIDDVDGDEPAAPFDFTFQGIDYTLDLNEENTKLFTEILADAMPFLVHARQVRSGTHTRPATAQASVKRPKSAPDTSGPDPKTVREWAQSQGIEVAARGRLNAKVVEAYLNAH